MTRANFSTQYLKCREIGEKIILGKIFMKVTWQRSVSIPKHRTFGRQSEPYLSQTQASIVRKQTFQCQQLFGNIWPSVYTSTRWVCIQASGLTFTFMYMYTSNFFLLRPLSCCIGNYYFMNECVDRLEVFSQNPQWDVIRLKEFSYSDVTLTPHGGRWG